MVKAFAYDAFRQTDFLDTNVVAPCEEASHSLTAQNVHKMSDADVAAHAAFFDHLLRHSRPLKEKATLVFVPAGRGIFKEGSKKVFWEKRVRKDGKEEAFLPLHKLQLVTITHEVMFGGKVYYCINSATPRFIRSKYCAKSSAKELGPLPLKNFDK